MKLRLTKDKEGCTWLHITAGHKFKRSGDLFASINLGDKSKSPIIQQAIDLAIEEQSIDEAQATYLATIAK